MTSNEKFQQDVFLQKFGKDVFYSSKTAVHPASSTQIATVFGLAFLVVLAVGILTLQPAKSLGADELIEIVETQGVAATKTDRVLPSSQNKCDGQAWGAWSADCASALSGGTPIRQIGYVTVEQTPSTSNETVLTRIPAIN